MCVFCETSFISHLLCLPVRLFVKKGPEPRIVVPSGSKLAEMFTPTAYIVHPETSLSSKEKASSPNIVH
jgi:hypothetical protein